MSLLVASKVCFCGAAVIVFEMWLAAFDFCVKPMIRRGCHLYAIRCLSSVSGPFLIAASWGVNDSPALQHICHLTAYFFCLSHVIMVQYPPVLPGRNQEGPIVALPSPPILLVCLDGCLSEM